MFAGLYKTVLEILKYVDRRNANHKTLHTPHLSPDGTLISNEYFTIEEVMRSPEAPLKPIHSMIAGAVGGYFIWGNFTVVNYQIIQYLIPRIFIATCQLLAKNNALPFASPTFKFTNLYRLLATITWSSIMYLYETYPSDINHNLKLSMDEIYRGEGVYVLEGGVSHLLDGVISDLLFGEGKGRHAAREIPATNMYGIETLFRLS